MKKKVGNIIISIFLLFLSYGLYASEPGIILRMQDMNHEPISQAMCQAPFILQVELKNLDGYTDIHLMQYIIGIENFKSSRSMTSHNVSIDNGKKTVKIFYNFVLRSDKKGTFTLGPVQLKDASGKTVRSNRLVVYVGDEIISSEKKQKDKYFITMELDKKQAYVGEKIILAIKFYDRLFVDDLHIQFPEFENIYILKSHDILKKNIVEIDGEEYSVTSWNFDIYPKESGPLIFQDIYAVFFAPELESRFKLGGAFDFFRSLQKSEQYVGAKPVKIEILPLPKSQQISDVVAVGQFSKYVITVNQNSVPVGQGVVLTTELFGEANFEMIPSSQLVLPEGFKYYDSNMVTIDRKKNYKRSEFIIQADTVPGSYHIESQKLVYFDPIEKEYKILRSNELDITVTPAVHVSRTLEESNIIDEYAQEHQDVEKELQDFKFIDTGSIHVKVPYMIPLLLYQQILWFFLLFIWCFFIYRHGIKSYILQHRKIQNFIIFYRAKKACQVAVQKENNDLLQRVFTKLFSQLIGIPVGKLNSAIMIHYLQEKNFSDAQLHDWTIFYQQILKLSFSSQGFEKRQDLYAQALAWIEILKEKA